MVAFPTGHKIQLGQKKSISRPISLLILETV